MGQSVGTFTAQESVDNPKIIPVATQYTEMNPVLRTKDAMTGKLFRTCVDHEFSQKNQMQRAGL